MSTVLATVEFAANKVPHRLDLTVEGWRMRGYEPGAFVKSINTLSCFNPRDIRGPDPVLAAARAVAASVGGRVTHLRAPDRY